MRTRGEILNEINKLKKKINAGDATAEDMDAYVRLLAEFNACVVGLQEFMRVYKKWLIYYRERKPEDYTWEMSQLNEVFTRMFQAVARNRFNKNSDAIKSTCKELGISWTYKAIAEFVR